MVKIAILASGSGTNAENIAKYFQKKSHLASVIAIISDKSDAKVFERAKILNIPHFYVHYSKKSNNENFLLKILKKNKIDFVILAGYLKLIPQNVINEYRKKIVNIHPALLPKYGGKGMYGENVHKAVIDSGDNKSGITIHYVNEKYDEGEIIFQAECPVFADDTLSSLQQRIHELEYKYYPEVIENLIIKL